MSANSIRVLFVCGLLVAQTGRMQPVAIAQSPTEAGAGLPFLRPQKIHYSASWSVRVCSRHRKLRWFSVLALQPSSAIAGALRTFSRS